MTSRYHAAAPVRLDFAGGWTDVPPFSTREGGVVVTASVRLFAHAQVCPGGARFRLASEDLHDEIEVDAAGLAPDGRLDLLKAGLRMFPTGPCALTTRCDAPPGSGLGSSGAIDVALVSALSLARGEQPTARAIADAACHLEAVEAGVPGGRQDQFAAAHGGFLRLEFHDPDVRVERLTLDPEFRAELERRMILLYTGASRFSGATIRRVVQAYECGAPTVVSALCRIRDVGVAMAEALRASDFAAVGTLLNENWRQQQVLDPGMCTSEMARLEKLMLGAGVLGGKAAGAGAGGCMFFLGPDNPTPAVEVARAAGAALLPVRWADEGVQTW